jgi:RNA polymerase sigma-70 factor (ECF subfamily)
VHLLEVIALPWLTPRFSAGSLVIYVLAEGGCVPSLLSGSGGLGPVTGTTLTRSVAVTDASDARLIRSVLAGDVEAFAGLVERHRDRLGRFALHMLGNREDAEEALQDAFLRAFRSLARCEDPSRFDAWLFRILVNRCRTAGGRRARRERTFVSGEGFEASEEHPAERLAWREEIGRALMALEAEQREAFLLKHVEELSYEEMQALTGAGVSALKMRVKRACDRLRGLLEETVRV